VKTIIYKYGFGLLASAFLLLVASCSSNNADSTKKSIAPQNKVISAPASLQGTALAFEINKTELVSGTEQRLYRDGKFKSYFFADRIFSDGRDYNGLSWGSEYQYTANGNQSDITQLLKIPTESGVVEVTVKTRLTYLTSESGTFELDIDQNHGAAGGSMRYHHTGSFYPTDTAFEVMEKGLPNSNLDFIFQNITANEKNLDIKPGSKITMNFNNLNSAKFTLNNKDYETKDYQLIPIDTFKKRIKGTLNGDIPFEVQLHFDQFHFGQFEANVGNGAFKANGLFRVSRYIPVADYKIQGKFTDGLKYRSKHTKIEYPYSVYLPPNYAHSNKKYPVLYLTDGQWVKEFHKAVEAHHKEFIVVAIEQGPENRRWEDFRLPGATSYIRFLKEEIIPHVEKQYRANTQRIFWGASLGASLGEIILSQETNAKPYFNTYAFADGAFWANPPDVREKLKSTLAQPKAEKILILTSSSRQGNLLSDQDFIKSLKGLNNASLDIQNIELKLTHEEMATPTFEHYLNVMQ
jgi:predicted alpha/beta superfamily hydrolase